MAGTFFLTDDTIKSLANIFKQKGIPSLTNTGKKDVENLASWFQLNLTMITNNLLDVLP